MSPLAMPQAEPEQSIPVTLHFTAVLVIPITVASTTSDPPIPSDRHRTTIRRRNANLYPRLRRRLASLTRGGSVKVRLLGVVVGKENRNAIYEAENSLGNAGNGLQPVMPPQAPRSRATSPEVEINFISLTVPSLRMANAMVTFHFYIIGNFADSGSSDKKQEPPAIEARAHSSDPDFANWCSGGSAEILRWESLAPPRTPLPQDDSGRGGFSELTRRRLRLLGRRGGAAIGAGFGRMLSAAVPCRILLRAPFASGRPARATESR
jgi:hypothetical protein